MHDWRGIARPKFWPLRLIVHVAQKCAAILGYRHAEKQRPKAHRVNTFERDAL
ncbi:hypothetical protein SAMCFNEI73_pC0590 (plasmid) [Sinorhizobium americanum]|uniref:Uncharacterized protein n=1 Tax=Sinorhizobium americanum TaxID=194963 RepID=A0A1L3LW64_9HYPH|nr:hypothetical protein SAMCFNEI73_pC0590 [Sinorhizobium americanum]